MPNTMSKTEKKVLDAKLKSAYKKYVAYFKTGAIKGDKPMSWAHWKKGTAANEIKKKFERFGR